MQLELYRLAAQEFLQRFAPDLTAIISAILRTYTRSSPSTAGTMRHATPAADAAAAPLSASQQDLLAAMPLQGIESMGSGTSADAAAQGEQQQFLASGMQVGSGAQPNRRTSRFDQASAVSFDGLVAEDSQQELLGNNDQMSSSLVPNRRTSKFNQLPTVLSNVPMEQLPFEPLSPDAQPVATAVEQALPMTTASVRAQAWQLQQQLVQEMKQGRLVMLGAGETMQLASHCVVLQGSVKLQGQPMSGGTAPGTCKA